ncbi:hypothetical protein [Calidifontibacter terrae]
MKAILTCGGVSGPTTRRTAPATTRQACTAPAWLEPLPGHL